MPRLAVAREAEGAVLEAHGSALVAEMAVHSVDGAAMQGSRGCSFTVFFAGVRAVLAACRGFLHFQPAYYGQLLRRGSCLWTAPLLFFRAIFELPSATRPRSDAARQRL